MYTTATLVNPWPGEACARTSASFVKFYQAIFLLSTFFHCDDLVLEHLFRYPSGLPEFDFSLVAHRR
jgi:hypothetical protein